MKKAPSKLNKSIFIGLLIGIIFATGFTFAWNAVWHGTDWIQSGAMIESKKIAENFEYLYSRVGPGGELVPPDCWGADKKLGWKNNAWICESNAVSSKMCRLWYRIGGDSNGWSNWESTPWANFDSQWYSGASTQSPGSWVNPGKAQLKLECQQAPAPMSIEYAINQDQWDGSTIADINQAHHASVPAVQDGIEEGGVAKTRKLSRPNNAVFGAKIQGSGEICSIAYRIAGDGNHWSNWQQDGILAFTGRANGKTYLSTLNNMVLQMQLCCGSSCSTIGVGTQSSSSSSSGGGSIIPNGDCGGGGC